MQAWKCNEQTYEKGIKKAYGKDIEGKMHCMGNKFLTKREVSTHEAIKRVLSLPMGHSNIDVSKKFLPV